MRSIKKNFIDINGCKLYPGKMYLLKFPEREVWSNDYIFEFDSTDIIDNKTVIYHRNKWLNGGVVRTCRGRESMVRIVNGQSELVNDNGEKITISRYRKVIDWDNI